MIREIWMFPNLFLMVKMKIVVIGSRKPKIFCSMTLS